MTNFIRKFLISSAVITLIIGSTSDLGAYEKKAPYDGYGKTSEVNGRPKTKPVKGHTKKTTKGYTYVNPYYRSK